MTITITNCNANSGYRLYITKGDPNGEIEETTEIPIIVIPEDTYRIVNRNSGKILSVENDSKNNAANVHQWTYDGRTSQQWKISDDGGYRILNMNANKVLDMDGNTMNDGGNAIIWPDTGGLNQRWLIEYAGDGYFNIINYNSGKALDIDKGSSADGGNVIQRTLSNDQSQQWQLIPIDSDTPIKPTKKETETS